MADYRMLLDDCLQKLIVYEKDTDWKLHKDDGVVKLFKKPSREFDGIIYRAEFIFNVSPEKGIQLTCDHDFVMKSNKHVSELELIERLDDATTIVRTASPSLMMGLISPREFINVMGIHKFDDLNSYLAYHVSVEHPKCPINPDIVRAIAHPSGRFIHPVEGQPNKCRVVGFTQSDLKLFPQSLIEQFAPGSIRSHIKGQMQEINAGRI